MALGKGEGALFDSFGLGKKVLGSPGSPMHVLVDNIQTPNGVMGQFTGDLSFLNAGMKLPDVVLKGEAPARTMNWGSIASGLMSSLPAFASGGAIDSGTLAMVGEKGPELFMPKTSGTIIPNNKISNYSSGDNHIHVDARGAHDPGQVEAAVHRAMGRYSPGIVAASVRATKEQRARMPQSAR